MSTTRATPLLPSLPIRRFVKSGGDLAKRHLTPGFQSRRRYPRRPFREDTGQLCSGRRVYRPSGVLDQPCFCDLRTLSSDHFHKLLKMEWCGSLARHVNANLRPPRPFSLCLEPSRNDLEGDWRSEMSGIFDGDRNPDSTLEMAGEIGV